MILDALEVAILACLISLGLNVWLLNRNGKLHYELDRYTDQAATPFRENTVLLSEINDLRPKRDAHGRFTR